MRTLLGVLATAMIGVAAPAQTPAAPPVRVLTEQELVDMMLGSSIQASRGANTEATVVRLKEAIAQGKTFSMISVEDVPDDWMVVVPAGVGGGGAWQHVRDRITAQGIPTVPDAQRRAIDALSNHIGKSFKAVMRVESAGATISALLAAADMGVPIVDGCLSGRARPEIQQQIPYINGIPAYPAALTTRWGDVVIIDRAVDDYRVEDLARAVAVSSGGGSAMALNPMSGADIKRGVLRGSLTEAIRLGRTVREARAAGTDPIAALIRVTKGYKLFEGRVTKSDDRGDRGFSWSDVEIRGTKDFTGHTYKVFVKNENIVTWIDGRPDAMSPDYIANLDPATGDAINPRVLGSYPVGQDVVLVGWPASEMWRTPKGIAVFGPRHFGIDLDYVPIEELQRARKLR